ncbi:MAG: FtsX-like permease family protein [Bacteroidota bacterium]
MFKNYLLLSLKVLKRKPFYTFVSLFGISFTLMILMLLTSLFDATLGANQPQTERDRMVILPTLERTRTETDTIITIDTIAMNDGTMRYDTTENYEDDITSTSNGPMSYKFALEQLGNLENAAATAIVSTSNHVDGYLNGRKISFDVYYANAGFWDVFDYQYIHGDRFYEEDVTQANKVAIITDKASIEYFGVADVSIIGKEMELGSERFRVRGIVKRPLTDSPYLAGSVYLPVTTLDNRALSSEEVYGGFMTAFLAHTPAGRKNLQDEINLVAENFQLPAHSDYDRVELFNGTFFDAYAQALLQERDAKKAKRMLFIPVIILLFLFVALPLLNLVNLNIGRVHERKAEIGVRKAFGANGSDILAQFVFENLVLTFIGGIIGMFLAMGLISYVNQHDLLGITRLSYSPQVFLYFLIIILIFGFLSGILPAYRMSKTNVANSLR